MSATEQTGSTARPTAAPATTHNGSSSHSGGSTHAAATPANRQFTVPSFLAALKLQESGNYGARPHGGSSASGAYQYLKSTWNNYGGYAEAWMAPREVQDRRATEDVNASLKRYGGDWRKVAAAHFAGAGWVAQHPDPSTWGVNPVPGSHNPTVAGYVSSLFGHAGQSADGIPQGATPTAGESAAASAAGSGALPANATPAQVKAAVASQFGYLSAFLDDPEVGPILMKAAKEGWDTPTLQGALFKTNFWQKHGANQRQFDAQTKLDPATQKAQIASVAADLQAQARKTGLTLTPAQYGQIATDSLKYGWSPQQTTNALLGEGKLDYSGKQGPSQIASVMDGLRGTAKSYFVPVSDQALAGWAKQVVSGQISQGDFDAYVKTQAKSLFPSLSTAIDRGVTVDQYVDPYRQLAAQTLELNPSNIDFTNPKFNKALFQKDPKTGDNTSMSLSDFGTYLRGLPEYAKTAKANDDVAQFGTQLLNTFGKIQS